MILLDSTDIKVSCLNIPDNQLPVEMVSDLRQYVMPEYIDRDTGLEEDMFSLEDVEESFKEANVWEKWESTYNEVRELIEKYECGYFRIIKTKFNVQQAEGANTSSVEGHEEKLTRV